MKTIEHFYQIAFANGLHAFVTFFLFFMSLYFGGIFIYNLLLRYLKKKKQFRPIQQNYRKGQITTEIKYSLISITIFSLQAIPLQWLIQHGIANVSFSNAWVLLWQIPVIFLWNEFHFYICHALLHKRWWMKNVHYIHHGSKEPTLYSVYSFHWVEAFLLGTVIFPPMLLYSFHFFAILSLPIISVVLNLMGHSNHEVPSHKDPEHISRFVFRHSMHHKWSNGNFGFMLPFFDKIFNTNLPKNKN